jgi:serine/threonine-protein kinase
MDPLLARLQRALAGRYTVEHELGRGGMATVFLGQDLRLERRVAIKVFEKEGGLISAGERFLREIRFAARLQHPNILPVHESGEGEGLVYYVMPYVAGGSVRERLEREGPLPVPDAVRIAREVAEALDHAHRAGIVHRDIKPDNIMLADGVAVVADFGIARALEEAGGKVTDTGLAIGTPTYMSPEQAAASPQLDGRTDIYSLGCVLYEMLAGTPPFSGTTAQQVMARHATDTAPPLSTVRQVPPALEGTITKALAKLPGDRWPTGRSLAEALSGTTTTPAAIPGYPAPKSWRKPAAALLLILGVGSVWWLTSQGGAVAESPGVRSVAVLPFTSSGDSTHYGLADGITEGVSTALVRVEGLAVHGGARVEAYRDRTEDPQAVGRDLGVSAIINGSLRLAGNRFRVTAQLTDVGTGRALWRQHFDGELVIEGRLKDVFTVVDDITALVVDSLRVRLAPAGRAALARGIRTPDPEAYDLYLKARRALQSLVPGVAERAPVLLEQALQRDSLFADAWVSLAGALYFSYHGGLSAAEAAARSYNAVERGIRLDSLNGLAFSTRAELKWSYYWDWDGAWLDMKRAVELSPASADVAFAYAWFLTAINEVDSSLVYLRRARALGPADAPSWNMTAGLFMWAKMPDSALAASQEALRLDSTAGYPYVVQMNTHWDAGRRAEADRAAHLLRQRAGNETSVLAFLAVHYRRTGNRKAAQEVLEQISSVARQGFVSPSIIGAVRLAVGDRTGALDALEEAARTRDLDLPLGLVLWFSPLSGDPRYEAVVRNVFAGRSMRPSPIAHADPLQ